MDNDIDVDAINQYAIKIIPEPKIRRPAVKQEVQPPYLSVVNSS